MGYHSNIINKEELNGKLQVWPSKKSMSPHFSWPIHEEKEISKPYAYLFLS